MDLELKRVSIIKSDRLCIVVFLQLGHQEPRQRFSKQEVLQVQLSLCTFCYTYKVYVTQEICTRNYMLPPGVTLPASLVSVLAPPFTLRDVDCFLLTQNRQIHNISADEIVCFVHFHIRYLAVMITTHKSHSCCWE